MATKVSEHLHDFHRDSKAIHASALVKARADGDEGGAQFHDAMVALHGKCMDACQKAAADELAKANQIVPDQIRSVIPTNPNAGIQPVTRHGQPEIRVPDLVDKRGVEIQFEDLLKVE